MYSIDDFQLSFRQISPIYYSVYEYLRTQVVGYDERCLDLRSAFFSNEINLSDLYASVCSMSEAQMQIAIGMWEDMKTHISSRFPATTWELTKDSVQSFSSTDHGSVAEQVRSLHAVVFLLKYIYNDIQSSLLLYNAILNKVFFQEKFDVLLRRVNEDTGLSQLEILTVIDNSTQQRYTAFKDDAARDAAALSFARMIERIQTPVLRCECLTLVEQYSHQKLDEKLFTRAFFHWSPLTIDIRDTIGCLLESLVLAERSEFEIMPFYTLLPMLDESYLPATYSLVLP